VDTEFSDLSVMSSSTETTIPKATLDGLKDTESKCGEIYSANWFHGNTVKTLTYVCGPDLTEDHAWNGLALRRQVLFHPTCRWCRTLRRPHLLPSLRALHSGRLSVLVGTPGAKESNRVLTQSKGSNIRRFPIHLRATTLVLRNSVKMIQI
jgi:hypothetical protein